MPRSDPYDMHREEYSYFQHRAQNIGTGWLVAAILIVAVVAVTMFFNRPEYGVMNTPGTSSGVNPPITQPATPSATNPNQNR